MVLGRDARDERMSHPRRHDRSRDLAVCRRQALALNGDFLRGLGLLQTAQSQLTAVAASGDPIMAPKARAILDLITSVIGEIDTVARGSM